MHSLDHHPMPPSPSAKHKPKRLTYELVITPRSAWLCAFLALFVTLVGRNRPEVSLDQVRKQSVDVYNIPVFKVSRYTPEDFVARFNRREDLEAVLNAPTTIPTPLLWRRWWPRQSMVAVSSSRFKVLMGMRGIPFHAWGIPTAELNLGFVVRQA